MDWIMLIFNWNGNNNFQTMLIFRWNNVDEDTRLNKVDTLVVQGTESVVNLTKSNVMNTLLIFIENDKLSNIKILQNLN